uniref:Tail fiber protein n=1 Tax=Escherichia virus LS2 TaxID=2743776 RepID=A0A7D5G6L8_9CAUD
MASTITQFPSGNTRYRIEFDYLARTFVVVTLVNSSNPALNRVLKLVEITDSLIQRSTITQFPSGNTRYRIEFDYLARTFVVVTLVNSSNPALNRVLKLVEITDSLIQRSTITQFPSGNTRYRIEFDYLARTFVVVTLVNSSNPALNRVLKLVEITDSLIQRQTVLTASDLTNAELQAIHIAEEGRDQTVDLAKEYADAAGNSAGNAKDSEDEARRIAESIKASGLGYITRRPSRKASTLQYGTRYCYGKRMVIITDGMVDCQNSTCWFNSTSRIENEGVCYSNGEVFTLWIYNNRTASNAYTNGILITKEYSNSPDLIFLGRLRYPRLRYCSNGFWVYPRILAGDKLYNPLTGAAMTSMSEVLDFMRLSGQKEVTIYTSSTGLTDLDGVAYPIGIELHISNLNNLSFYRSDWANYPLTASDLTNAELQAIHIAEEGRDQTVDLAKEYADAAGNSAGNAKDSEDEARRIAESIKASGLGYITRRPSRKASTLQYGTRYCYGKRMVIITDGMVDCQNSTCWFNSRVTYDTSGYTVITGAIGLETYRLTLNNTDSGALTQGRIAARAFGNKTLTESEQILVLDQQSSASAHSLILGGGSSVFKSATSISFATNPSPETVGGTIRWRIDNTSLRPYTDNAYNLGGPALRVAQVFAAIGTINTSDSREKLTRLKSRMISLMPGRRADNHVQVVIFYCG